MRQGARASTRREMPNRKIYCLDLRVHDQAQPYIDEVKRIARENAMQLVRPRMDWIGGCQPKPEQLAAVRHSPTNDTAPRPHAGRSSPPPARIARGRNVAAHRRRVRPPLVSGDRLQPLHELHGVHRLLPVRRVRRR